MATGVRSKSADAATPTQRASTEAAEIAYLRERVGQLEQLVEENARLVQRIAAFEQRHGEPGSPETGGAVHRSDSAAAPPGETQHVESVAGGLELADEAVVAETNVIAAPKGTFESPPRDSIRIVIFGPRVLDDLVWKHTVYRELLDLLLGMPKSAEVCLVTGILSASVRPRVQKVAARLSAPLIEANEEENQAYAAFAADILDQVRPDLVVHFYAPTDIFECIHKLLDATSLAVCAMYGSPVAESLGRGPDDPARIASIAALTRAGVVIVNSATVRNAVASAIPDANARMTAWLRGAYLGRSSTRKSKPANRTRAVILVETQNAADLRWVDQCRSLLNDVPGLSVRFIGYGVDASRPDIVAAPQPSGITGYLADTDIVIGMPGACSFPQLIMESMALGIPCILSADALSLFPESESAFVSYDDLKSLRDRLLKLHANPAEHAAAGKAARAFALKHLNRTDWQELLEEKLRGVAEEMAR